MRILILFYKETLRGFIIEGIMNLKCYSVFLNGENITTYLLSLNSESLKAFHSLDEAFLLLSPTGNNQL